MNVCKIQIYFQITTCTSFSWNWFLNFIFIFIERGKFKIVGEQENISAIFIPIKF